ncbi:MAG: type II and III secretion system protein family protein [Rhizomicrobium sp.]|jgi:pilus assembly protein CpaC
MRKRLLALGLVALAAFAGPADARATNVKWDDARVISVSARGNNPASEHITLGLNKAAIVQLDSDARDVMVSNPAIVDAVVRTPRRVFLLGVKTGQSNAFFFDAAGHQILSIDIHVERDVTDLSAMMHADISGSDIHVSALNDNIVLTGSVANAQDSARAQDLAARVADDPKKVVNMLKIQGGEQVLLKVRVAEIERDVSKQFGINLEAAVSAAGVPIIAATANPYGLLGQALAAGSGLQVGSVGTPSSPGPNNLQGVLNALEQVGLVHTLAEPNLVAVSGETAKFLAGGEFPVPVSRDQFGNVVVDFKQFGVGLSFTPVVLSPNRISLQVSTEVSELTNEGAFLEQAATTTNSTGSNVTTAGLAIPALAVRRAETTIELPSGGSFAIAGLMQHVTKQDIDGFPGLQEMPVLGALFRSRDFQNNETELVVIVSAYLVNPTSAAKLASPTDGFVPATDADTILTGKVNTVYTKDAHGLKAADDGKVGFIVE